MDPLRPTKALLTSARRLFKPSLPSWAAILPAALLSSSLAAQTVHCHIDYGGERRILSARPTTTPYERETVQVGSYFLLRLVMEDPASEGAAFKMYVYAVPDEGPVLLHQLVHPLPLAGGVAPRYGFTGLNFVYEPLRDGELQYWCALAAPAEAVR